MVWLSNSAPHGQFSWMWEFLILPMHVILVDLQRTQFDEAQPRKRSGADLGSRRCNFPLEINAPILATPSTHTSPSLHPLQREMEMEGILDHGQQLGQTKGPWDQGCRRIAVDNYDNKRQQLQDAQSRIG
jgi:hypothetical protein